MELNEMTLDQRAQQEMQMLQATAEKKQREATAPKAIGEKEVRRAADILKKYKQGKETLEKRIIANEVYYKLKQWERLPHTSGEFTPATSWLWSCIESRYSDAMDSYPTCNFLPRQQDDEGEAKMLSDIVPIIMEQNRYEDTYSDVARYVLKHGGAIQGVFWDGSAHNGLGDIKVKKIDILNFFCEPHVKDIQDSQNIFTTELVDKRIIEQRYPETTGKLNGKAYNVATYIYDDPDADINDKVVVVDWYYHKYVEGKKTLQYVKFVNQIVLYATENETTRPEKVVVDPQTGVPLTVPTGLSMAERGLYDHAMYPFVATQLYPIEGSFCGYGIIDIGRDTQIIIDYLNKAMAENAISGAKPRYFTRNDRTINEEEFADTSKSFVHVDGSVSEEYIRPIETKRLDPIYLQFHQAKIDELKHITANQDVMNGVAASGVTAGSAIAALQESAGKNARSSNKALHRAYRDVIYQVVELIRQFYDIPRTFRITPEGAKAQYVAFDNSGLKEQPMSTFGNDMGLRLPEFDIEITSEKANPYKQMEMNELAINFYNLGFFNPQMTDQALACLKMMDFSSKEQIIQMISKNGTMQEMLIRYQQIALELANQISPQMGEQVAQMILQNGGQQMPVAIGDASAVDINTEGTEHPLSARAREQARASTQEG